MFVKRWTGTLEERFLQHTPERGDGCWLWAGAVMSTGYGKLTWQYQQMLAHRASYELHVGPIPDGMQIDHLCEVRLCVNPKHLEPVMQYENLRRAADRRVVCRNGHLRSEHRHILPSGVARCRLCDQALEARRIR